MILFLLKVLIGLVLAAMLLCVARTWQMEHSPRQALFEKGIIPNPLPDGMYQGSVPGHTFSWLGKKFNAADSTGINVFSDAMGGQTTKYPFKTSVGKGVHDANLDVLKIDYNIPDNPLWLRLVLDEVVQTGPDQYLGKLQFRIIPGYPFTLSYFELKK